MNSPDHTRCAIYKGNKKTDVYLFVKAQGDFSRVPDTLLKMLGKLELVMELELDEERRLAQSDTHQVMSALSSQGYYLQIPPKAYIKSG